MIKYSQAFIKVGCFLILIFSQVVSAVEFPALPNPFRYVNDYTKTLSVQELATLEAKLVNYGQETSSQIAVAIIPSTEGYPISQYAFELGDKWGVGRKKDNNGVLMVVAKNDRKVFIATGQGLQGVLTDAFLAELIRQIIIPQFRNENYAKGISDGLDYIIATSKGEFAPYVIQSEDDLEQYVPYLMLALFILFVVINVMRRKHSRYISPTNNHIDELLRQQAQQIVLNRHRGGFYNDFGHGTFGRSDNIGSFGGRNQSGGSFGGRNQSGGSFGGGSFDGGGAGGSW